MDNTLNLPDWANEDYSHAFIFMGALTIEHYMYIIKTDDTIRAYMEPNWILMLYFHMDGLTSQIL